MEKFVMYSSEWGSIVVEAKTAEAAAKIASESGKNVMKNNNRSTLFSIWDEQEETIFFMVHTFKQGRKIISKIEPRNI